MKKWSSLGLVFAVGAATGAYGQTTVFDSSAASYTAGDLEGQNSWTQLLNYDTNGVPVLSNQVSSVAFTVDNTSWLINDVASDAAFLVETNAASVYLNEASAGNELYSEWTGEMDFSFNIPQGTYAGNGTMPNANFFAIGLTSSTTNGLSQFQDDDVILFLRYRANNRLDMQLCTEQDADLRIFQTPSDGTTWAEPAGQEILGMNPQLGDCQSDELHLTWTIRKTTDGNYQGWGSVSNTVTGAWVDDIRTNGLGGKVVSTEGKNKSAGVYASNDPVLAMGRNGGAFSSQYQAFGNGLLDMDIESLTVTKSIVSPALTAPANVAATAYDSQVTVSWDPVLDAESYDVFRGTISGSHTLVTNVTGLSAIDQGLSNGTEYFYVVQSVFPGFSNSTNSLEVSDTPAAIFKGSVIDHGFTTVDGYADGDLAGQLGASGWKAAENTTANAFNITNAAPTDGQASTMGNGFINETNLSNAVYLDRLMDNNEDDTWEGTLDFQIQSYLAEGQSVATLLNADIFTFGVTRPESQDDEHNLYSGNQALLSVRLVADGNVAVLFSTENSAADTRLAQLQRENMGWDPEDEEADGVSAADLITDTITLDWSIRKTRDDDVYQATATLTSSGVSAPAATNASLAFTTDTLANMYASPSAKFTMSQYKNAWKTNTTLTNKADVILHSLSLVATNSLPIASAPTGITMLSGDRSVTIGWDATLEANSYDLLLAETSGGPQMVVTNVTDSSVIDMPRFNGVTNWYTVRGIFDTGTADSVETPGVPIASVTALEFDGLSPDGVTQSTLTTAQILLGSTDGLATNGTVTYINKMSGTPLLANGAGSGAYSGPTWYGLTQINTDAADITDGRGESLGFRLANNQNNNGHLSDNFEYRQNGGATRAELLWFVESTDWLDPTASVDAVANTVGVTIANKLMSSGTHQIAVRNGSQWYVSQDSAGNGTSGNGLTTGTLAMQDIAAEMFGAITVNPGTLIAQPSVWDTGENLGFTDVNAIGWFSDEQIRLKPFKLIVTLGGSVPSTEYWMSQYATVTNLTDDTDGDMLSNLKEYAFGGDPEDADDQGTLPSYYEANVDGTNGYIVVHHELRDPVSGIDYSLETDENLAIAGGWTPVPEGDQLGEENIDYYTKAVSNFIPVDVATKFIDLKVNEE